jgi:hypothetical protein
MSRAGYASRDRPGAAGLIKEKLLMSYLAMPRSGAGVLDGHAPVAPAAVDRAIRVSTAVAVLTVAGIAAYVSYWHAYAVVDAGGENGITARLEPATIDGLVYASSMVNLYAARHRLPVPALARWLLGLGIAATLAAKAAQISRAKPSGREPSTRLVVVVANERQAPSVVEDRARLWKVLHTDPNLLAAYLERTGRLLADMPRLIAFLACDGHQCRPGRLEPC